MYIYMYIYIPLLTPIDGGHDHPKIWGIRLASHGIPGSSLTLIWLPIFSGNKTRQSPKRPKVYVQKTPGSNPLKSYWAPTKASSLDYRNSLYWLVGICVGIESVPPAFQSYTISIGIDPYPDVFIGCLVSCCRWFHKVRRIVLDGLMFP